MAEQKMGKCKNLIRSAREKSRNQSRRDMRVRRARERHIKNAMQSCGKKFADWLRSYYAGIGTAPKKAGK